MYLLSASFLRRLFWLTLAFFGFTFTTSDFVAQVGCKKKHYWWEHHNWLVDSKLTILPVLGWTIFDKLLAKTHVHETRRRIAALLFSTVAIFGLQSIIFSKTFFDHFCARLFPFALESFNFRKHLFLGNFTVVFQNLVPFEKALKWTLKVEKI